MVGRYRGLQARIWSRVRDPNVHRANKQTFMKISESLKTKFRVGDKVMVIDDSANYEYKNREIITVISVYDRAGACDDEYIYCRKDKRCIQAFYYERLKLVERAEKPTSKE